MAEVLEKLDDTRAGLKRLYQARRKSCIKVYADKHRRHYCRVERQGYLAFAV